MDKKNIILKYDNYISICLVGSRLWLGSCPNEHLGTANLSYPDLLNMHSVSTSSGLSHVNVICMSSIFRCYFLIHYDVILPLSLELKL